MEKGGRGIIPEPVTRSFPEYGKGGYTQLLPIRNMKVKFDEVTILPEE
jgi:hypothetical protein